MTHEKRRAVTKAKLAGGAPRSTQWRCSSTNLAALLQNLRTPGHPVQGPFTLSSVCTDKSGLAGHEGGEVLHLYLQPWHTGRTRGQPNSSVFHSAAQLLVPFKPKLSLHLQLPAQPLSEIISPHRSSKPAVSSCP